MIWLKENQKLVGYVPILEKEYNKIEIREMSEYHCYQGWSKLSEFIMQIQGIEFECYYGFADFSITEVQRLVDISFCFDFECFLQDNFKMNIYIGQIFDVFQNLTLYKVRELSEKEAKEEIAQAKKLLEGLISIKTLSNIDEDFLSIKSIAENSSNNLSNLQEMFENKGYTLDKLHLFANIDESITKKIYKKRKAKTRLEMRN